MCEIPKISYNLPTKQAPPPGLQPMNEFQALRLQNLNLSMTFRLSSEFFCGIERVRERRQWNDEKISPSHETRDNVVESSIIFLSSSKGSVRSNRRSFVKHLLNRKFLFRKFVRRQSDCLAGDVRNTKESPADGIGDLLENFLLIDSYGKIENDFQKKLPNGLHV